MELRLRDFASANGAGVDVVFEFVLTGRGLDSPRGVGRPVYDTPHGTLYYFPRDDALYGTLGGVTMRCEAGRGATAIAGASLTGFELYVATHPLATIALMEVMERRGLFSLHAGCLACDGRGVLLAGPSGAGKSTLTLALASGGLDLLSDDVVFLAPRNEGVQALGFADTIGVSPFAAACLPALSGLAAAEKEPGFPKPLRRIEQLFGAPSVSRCAPLAVVFPAVAAGMPSAIAPLDPRDALLRLTPDVLLTDPASTQAHLGAIAALLEQVRCYELRSGSDLERAADLVVALLR
jgi:hypothetical protein